MSPLDELTPRELVRLAKTRQTMEWDHTASLMAVAHNMMAKRAKKPSEFNPFRNQGSARQSSGLSLEKFAERVKGMKKDGA